MREFLVQSFPLIVLLFILVRSADLSITYGIAKSYLRAIAYGLVALFAGVAVVLMLLGK